MKYSLKFRLTAAFIALALFPLLLAGLLFAWQSYTSQKGQAIEFQREVSQRIADQTTALIDKAEAQLIVLSKSWEVDLKHNDDDHSAHLSAVLSSDRLFEELAVVDTDGLVLSHMNKRAVSSPEQLGLRFRSDKVLFSSSTGSANYGPVVFDDAGDPSMAISVPIVEKRSGTVQGFLVGIVRLKIVWELISLIRVGQGGIAYIVDEQNRVIAHRNPLVVLGATEYKPPKQDGFGIGLDGNEVVISSQTVSIGSQQFKVITEKPFSEAMALTIRSVITTGILLICALLIAGSLAWLAIRIIVRPINRLVTAAKALEEGDLGQRVDVTTSDELGTMGKAFNGMADRLKETFDALAYHNAELEQEVELRQIAEQNLRIQAQELARSNQELEQFAHIASHDLQEPLRMVSSYTQLLERRYKDKLDSDAREFISYAVDGAKRMQIQINDLLALSRVTTQGNSFEATDCSDVFELAVANLAAGIEESGGVVTRDPLPIVAADSSQLISVFQNLIGNSIKYHGDQPPLIHVSAVESGNEWLFSFRDNGIGIETEFAERIFVIFQRLHTKAAYPGTGIGLAICKKVIERHGGRIWVESEPRKGSAFYFTLPIGRLQERNHDGPQTN